MNTAKKLRVCVHRRLQSFFARYSAPIRVRMALYHNISDMSSGRSFPTPDMLGLRPVGTCRSRRQGQNRERGEPGPYSPHGPGRQALSWSMFRAAGGCGAAGMVHRTHVFRILRTRCLRPIAFYFCWGTAHNNILLTEVPWASCISTSLMSLGIGIGRL